MLRAVEFAVATWSAAKEDVDGVCVQCSTVEYARISWEMWDGVRPWAQWVKTSLGVDYTGFDSRVRQSSLEQRQQTSFGVLAKVARSAGTFRCGASIKVAGAERSARTSHRKIESAQFPLFGSEQQALHVFQWHTCAQWGLDAACSSSTRTRYSAREPKRPRGAMQHL